MKAEEYNFDDKCENSKQQNKDSFDSELQAIEKYDKRNLLKLNEWEQPKLLDAIEGHKQKREEDGLIIVAEDQIAMLETIKS